MASYVVLVILLISGCYFVQGITVNYKILSKLYLPYTYDPEKMYGLDEAAAEQFSYDEKTKLLYSVGKFSVNDAQPGKRLIEL